MDIYKNFEKVVSQKLCHAHVHVIGITQFNLGNLKNENGV